MWRYGVFYVATDVRFFSILLVDFHMFLLMKLISPPTLS